MGALFWSAAAWGADVTFLHVGFLAGDTSSRVHAVDAAGTLAACRSYHFEGNNRVDSYAARWTPTEGIKPLPRLPNTANAGADPYAQGARDLTADGSRIAFIAPTLDQTGVASGISDADGGNLIALTSLPNGELIPAISQLSDDGQTAFGYRLVDLYQKGAFWTAAGGIQGLIPLAGYTNVVPASRAISSDGTVSAGSLFKVDPNSFAVVAEQAYRWTSSAGIEGLGFLPGDEDSSTIAMAPNGSLIFGRSGASFFLWEEGNGMTEIAPPQPPTQYYGFYGGGGLSADGAVAVVAYQDIASGTAAPDISYILKTGTGEYIDLHDALVQVGAGATLDGWSDFHCYGITDDGNTVFGDAVSPDKKREGFIARFSPDYLRELVPPPPVITSPLTAEGFYFETFDYRLTASGMAVDFSATGLPAGLKFTLAYEGSGGPLIGLITGQPTEAGVFAVTVSATNSSGATTAVLQLTVNPSSTAPRLLNIATRGTVLIGENVLIGGFIIPNGLSKSVILRAIGPSLAPGITNALVDPVLSLYRPDGTVMTNDNWKDTQQTEVEETGIPPSDEREAAIVLTLEPGSYTAIVSGKNGGVGVGLFEAYDLDTAAGSKLGNIATRGFIGTGDDVLIGGVIVNAYVTYTVVRAIGPSLADANVANPLMDPTLEIYTANGTLTASNDDWQDGAAANQIEAFGLAPSDPREAAIFIGLLDPVTAIVRGKDGATGIGLVEVYNVDYAP
ncbi:MAG: Ig domain-containing protein [Chthoniobacterales bacterium]